MIEVKTVKDTTDNLHYVVSWSAVPAEKIVTLPNVHNFPTDKIPKGFFREYYKYYVDNGFLIRHPRK